MTDARGRYCIGRGATWAGLAATVALVLLLLASAASAASGTAAGLYVAQDVWGKPACGVPRVETSTPADYLRDHATGEFLLEPVAWADENRCVIVINANFTIRTPVKRCHVIAHEWGHLAGFRDPSNVDDPEHSANPRSLMFGHDPVHEIRERVGRKRWRWVADGAFRPCYAAVEDGVGGFG